MKLVILEISLPEWTWIPSIEILFSFSILTNLSIWLTGIPNLDSECPTLVLSFPPSKILGLTLIKIDSFEKLLENSVMDSILSKFTLTPSLTASLISSIETPFGVYIISLALNPAVIPNLISWMETASKPQFKFLINLRIDILDKALAAYCTFMLLMLLNDALNLFTWDFIFSKS